MLAGTAGAWIANAPGRPGSESGGTTPGCGESSKGVNPMNAKGCGVMPFREKKMKKDVDTGQGIPDSAGMTTGTTTEEATMSNPRCKHEEAKRRALECDRPAMIDCERYETDRPRREHIEPGGGGIDNGWSEDSRKGVRHA